MDTKPLERFATWARRELINAVDAQATAVLAVGSVARSERAEVVKKLEAEIAGHGRQHVVDKVAYTWFNRIIALRFMDARGYTDAGVVSPAQGQAYGQPEILSDAKRGNLDTDVVANTRIAEAIIGLLDGTRRSTDAEGEAYALLLTEYCRYWHKPMPFMFEREGDYTELLVPANLLADGAILARAREVLTEDVCDDVEVIGWLYQFYISERKAEVFAGFKKNKKAGAEEIPAATQLFTPHWIVRYVVENSLGRLWMLNRPTSRLVDQMDYYIAPAHEEADFMKIAGPEGLTVFDPACGSGHMLTYAFDLLYAIYVEEGYAPSEIPGLILSHNLHGTEIDQRAGSLAAFALIMKARAKQLTFFNGGIRPNICVLSPISFDQFELDDFWTVNGWPDVVDLVHTKQAGRHYAQERIKFDHYWRTFEHADVFGSLIQPDEAQTEGYVELFTGSTLGDESMWTSETVEKARRVVQQSVFLTRKYSVVVANPPYMGSKNMDARLSEFVSSSFNEVKSDLFAAFIYRCLEFVLPGGQVGFMTPFVWMFISSHQKLRERLLTRETVTSLIQLEYSGFDGATVPVCTFTVQVGHVAGYKAAFVRLADFRGSSVQGPKALEAIKDPSKEWFFRSSADDFATIPGSPIAYWLSPNAIQAFAQNQLLADFAEPRQGLATADNNQFLRLWHEVSHRKCGFGQKSISDSLKSGKKWFPYNKGGEFRRWYGNQDFLVNWENDGEAIRNFIDSKGVLRSVTRNPRYYFRPSVSWSLISSAAPAFRIFPSGFVFDVAGMSLFADSELERLFLLGLLNSDVSTEFLKALAPTLNFQVGDIKRLPVAPQRESFSAATVLELVEIAQIDWDLRETSWNFRQSPLVGGALTQETLESRTLRHRAECRVAVERSHELEIDNNTYFIDSFGLDGEIDPQVPIERISLDMNPAFHYSDKTYGEQEKLCRLDDLVDLVSYSVGCMFGRYGLDEPGLILGDQGATLRDDLGEIGVPSFVPDADNVIPFVDDGWFEDDIVDRFRQFLRVAFGTEHFEENLRFVEESLGVKTLRDYFITKAGKSKFYDDHVQRYKKRPIYWMFSSPKGSFNALIYMHRYTPSTVSTVLNEYLREYRAKLEVALSDAEQAAAGGGSAKHQKEADRLRKVLVELAEYEHDVLYPLATQQIVIDLDVGVKVNYPKFYPALKNIAGLEASE